MPATLRPSTHWGNGEGGGGGGVGRATKGRLTFYTIANGRILTFTSQIQYILLSSMKIKSLFSLFREMSNLQIQVKEHVLLASNNYRVSLLNTIKTTTVIME